MKKIVIFPIVIIITLFLAACSHSNGTELEKNLSSEKSILSYSMYINDELFEGKIDNNKREILIEDIPYDYQIKNLQPRFTVSNKAIVYINGVKQYSGKSNVDFSKTVIYKVVAENQSESQWTVKLSKKEPEKIVITFHKNIPNSESDETFIKEYSYKTTLTVQISSSTNENILSFPKLEDIDGYIFKGWALNSTETVHHLYSFTVAEDIDLYAVWESCMIKYRVKYYKETLDGNYNDDEDYSEFCYGLTGDKMEADISGSAFDGFVLDEDTTETGIISSDGTSVYNVYLKRDTFSYKINYYKQNEDGSYPTYKDESIVGSGKYGTTPEFDLSYYEDFLLDTDKTNSSITIDSDNSTVYDIYLKRKNTQNNEESGSYNINISSIAIIGKWYCSGGSLASYLEFYSNGTGKAYPSSPSNSSSFNWSISGNVLTMTGNVRNSSSITLTGDVLHISYLCGISNLTYIRK